RVPQRVRVGRGDEDDLRGRAPGVTPLVGELRRQRHAEALPAKDIRFRGAVNRLAELDLETAIPERAADRVVLRERLVARWRRRAGIARRRRAGPPRWRCPFVPATAEPQNEQRNDPRQARTTTVTHRQLP